MSGFLSRLTSVAKGIKTAGVAAKPTTKTWCAGNYPGAAERDVAFKQMLLEKEREKFDPANITSVEDRAAKIKELTSKNTSALGATVEESKGDASGIKKSTGTGRG